MVDSAEESRLNRRKALRNKIQQSIEVAKEEHRRELLKRRVEMARQGHRYFAEKNYGEAVKSFLTYLRVLEDWKGVSPGGLSPNNFDPKKDIAELLLINSVYWNLVRLFDQTKRNQSEFASYLEKYIQFSKGMRFAPLAAETLRKFLKTKNVVHFNELSGAYRAIGGSGARCFVATSLLDLIEPESLIELRRFRDQKLSRTPWGRAFIIRYYRVGPRMADWLDRCPHLIRQVAARTVDGLAQMIRD